MVRYAYLLAVGMGLWVADANARCPNYLESQHIAASSTLGSKAKMIFSCQMYNGKVLEICDLGDQIGFFYGRTGGYADRVFHIPRNQAYKYRWHYPKGSMGHRFYLPTGRQVYEVTQVYHIHHDDLEYWLSFKEDGAYVDEQQCKSAIVNNISETKMRQVLTE